MGKSDCCVFSIEFQSIKGDGQSVVVHYVSMDESRFENVSETSTTTNVEPTATFPPFDPVFNIFFTKRLLNLKRSMMTSISLTQTEAQLVEHLDTFSSNLEPRVDCRIAGGWVRDKVRARFDS